MRDEFKCIIFICASIATGCVLGAVSEKYIQSQYLTSSYDDGFRDGKLAGLHPDEKQLIETYQSGGSIIVNTRIIITHPCAKAMFKHLKNALIWRDDFSGMDKDDYCIDLASNQRRKTK